MRHSLALFAIAARPLATPLHAESVGPWANAARVTLFASGAAVVRLAKADDTAGTMPKRS